MSPAAVCAAYQQQGYDFLAITDHFLETYNYPIIDTTPFRSETFTTLIGAELHAPALANGQIWHMVAVGLPLDFDSPRDGETGSDLARRASDAGAFVALAHPAWYGASVEDLLSIPAAHAIEAYNEVCGRLNDKPESWFHVDQVLSAGRRVTAIGADDAHFRATMPKPRETPAADLPEGDASDDLLTELQQTATDPIATESGEELPAGFGTWVWVRAAAPEPDALVAALKAGDFYTSQGPVIHDIRVSDDRSTIQVVNSPAVSVFVTGRPDMISFGSKHAPQVTHSTFQIDAHAGSYVRVTVADAAGKRAWSNPIWLD
jgi:hypothetical protein